MRSRVNISLSARCREIPLDHTNTGAENRHHSTPMDLLWRQSADKNCSTIPLRTSVDAEVLSNGCPDWGPYA